MFTLTKNYFVEVSNDLITCDLSFELPPIKNPGYAYVSGLKRFLIFITSFDLPMGIFEKAIEVSQH